MLFLSNGDLVFSGSTSGPASGDRSESVQGTADAWFVKMNPSNGTLISENLIQDLVDGPSSTFLAKQASTDNMLAFCSSSAPSGSDKTENSLNKDYWMFELEANFALGSQATFNASLVETASDIIATSDGGYLLAGTSNSLSGFDKDEDSMGIDVWLIKLDANLTVEWQETLGGPNNELNPSVIEVSNGYVLACDSEFGQGGDKTVAGFGATDIWIVKLDLLGNVQNDTVIGGTSGEFTPIVKSVTGGGFLVACVSGSGISGNKTEVAYGSTDTWVVKLGSNAQIQWQKSFGTSGIDFPGALVERANGKFLVAMHAANIDGNYNPAFLPPPASIWLVQLDQTGVVEWEDAYGGTLGDFPRSMVEDGNGFIYVGAWSSSPPGGNKTAPQIGGVDWWILKLGTDCQQTYYVDADLDGFGDPGTAMLSCIPPPGYVLNGNDCDDSDPSIYPEAPCEDGDFCTTGEAIDSNCNCSGGVVLPDGDLDGICDLLDIDDGNACANGIPVLVGSSCNLQTYSTTGLSSSFGVLDPGCGAYQGRDIWFEFEVPSSGYFRTEVYGLNGFNARFALYAGCTEIDDVLYCDQSTQTQNFYLPDLIGQTLYLRVWRFNSFVQGDFEMCIWEPEVTPNDICSNAILLNPQGNCSGVSYNNFYSTSEAGIGSTPSCGAYVDGDVWFAIDVPQDGQFRIELQSQINNTHAYALYEGDCESLSEVSCQAFDGFSENFNYPQYAGQILYLRVWSYNNEEGGLFTLCVQGIDAPVNDFCSSATPLIALPVCNYQGFSTAFSSGDTDAGVTSSCGAFVGGDVWFTTVVPTSGHLRIEAVPLTPGAFLNFSVYSGTCGNLTELQCVSLDEFINIHDESLAGQSLYIRVFRHFNEEPVEFSMCAWQPDIPDNDFCSEATALAVGSFCQPAEFSSFGCTPEAGIPSGGGCPGENYYSSLWFTVEVPSDGQMIIDLFPGTLLSPNLALYTGDCNALTPYDCDNNSSANGINTGRATINDPALANETLYVMVYSFNERDGGSFGICALTDCDGAPVLYYIDQDQDGFGDPNESFSSCYPQPGYVANADDCDDTNPSVYVGASCDDADPNTGNDVYTGACLCEGLPIGCTEPSACNFDPSAGVDDGSCEFLSCSDDDMDGLTYEEETTIGTDPNDPDTDNDGVQDGEEVNTYGSNPLIQDTDGDGLTDGLEVNASLTDPTLPDTNGNGCEDAIEYAGACPGSCATDLNNDGVVNTGDLVLLLSSFGQACN